MWIIFTEVCVRIRFVHILNIFLYIYIYIYYIFIYICMMCVYIFPKKSYSFLALLYFLLLWAFFFFYLSSLMKLNCSLVKKKSFFYFLIFPVSLLYECISSLQFLLLYNVVSMLLHIFWRIAIYMSWACLFLW